MSVATQDEGPKAGNDGRRPEPTRMTLADLSVIVAGVALVMAIPSRTAAWPPYLAPPPLVFLVILGALRLTEGCGLVLALVLFFRRGRYGGPVRPAEWLALGFASLALLEAVPNLDDAVNAYYVAVGSTALDFGVARWMLSAPAALGLVLVLAGLAFLRLRARGGSRVASALAVVGIVAGLTLWFWGPCMVAYLELPSLLVPGLPGDPSSWGWRGSAVFALRAIVANAPQTLTWGLLAAATARAWGADRRRGRAWIWTEWAALADAGVAALLLLTVVGPQGPGDLVRVLSWVLGVGLVSWWITGLLGIGRDPGIVGNPT